jgi:DNA repair protein RecN (Recombination protein N)
MAELSEAQAGVEICLDALDFDPMELETAEERLFALRALARKHNVLADDLAGLADGLRARLAGLERGEVEIAKLRRAVDDAAATFDTAAAALSDARRVAGARLDAAMAAELAPLKMDRAIFTTRVTNAPPGPQGCDTVSFRVATNPGAPAGALDKIASGGELSRFLLALKVCLTKDARGMTLIFDEIDRGVGGATADAVGRRLAVLAREQGGQVLVVTHSPQVAALGTHHWRVEKTVADGMTRSGVVPLGPEARVDEIARMLAGDQITSAARDAARALLDG